MAQTRNRPEATTHGAASVQVCGTGPSIPPGWHEQAEWECALSYEQGRADGYAAAERDIAAEIARAVGVKPYDRRAVIRWLIRCIDLDQREPYSSPANGTTLGVAERDVIGRWAA